MSCGNMIHLTSSPIFIAEGLTHKLKFVHNIVQGKKSGDWILNLVLVLTSFVTCLPRLEFLHI